MEYKKKFYQKTWFKNTILISLPSLISAIGVIISLANTLSATTKNTLLIVIIVLMIIIIITVCFFSAQDDKLYNDYQNSLNDNKKLISVLARLDNDLKTSNNMITTFSEFFEKWSKNINSFANNVIHRRTISDKAWDKIKYFDTICLQCKNMVIQHCNNTDTSKISVSFVSYRETESGEKFIHMISHSNPESTRPNACKKEEKLTESNYYYADLIKDDYSDIEVAVNNEEILRKFHKITKNTDLSKYTQYIAIPVYCTSNKLLGIFQVVTKYDYIIEKDEISLRKFAEEKIIPFSNLIVLIEKINKGLYINPENIQMED